MKPTDDAKLFLAAFARALTRAFRCGIFAVNARNSAA